MSLDVVLAAASFASVSVLSSVATWATLRRRVRSAEERAETLLRGLQTQREAAERRVRDVRAELTRVESATLARHRVLPERVYPTRLAPRDADALAGALGGLAFVDAALVADAFGHALSRGTGDASAASSQPALALSAMGAAVGTLFDDLAESDLAPVEAHVETGDARHVTVRALRGRGEGAFIVAAATSRPVSALALDAVAQLARANDDGLAAPSSTKPARGTTERRAVQGSPLSAVWDELDREHAEHRDLRALVLGVDGLPVFSAAHDGPVEEARARALRALRTFADRAGARFRESHVARVDVLLEGGDVLHWVPLAARSRLSLVVLGDVGATSAGRIDRLAGRLRRKIAEAPQAASEGGLR